MKKIANNTNNNRIFLSPPHMGEDELRFVHEAFDSTNVAPLARMAASFERVFSE